MVKMYTKGYLNYKRVRRYFESHLCATQKECAEALGLSKPAVNRHTQSILVGWGGEPIKRTGDGSKYVKNYESSGRNNLFGNKTELKEQNRKEIVEYFKTHLCATQVDCALALKIHQMTVYQHVKEIRAEWGGAYVPKKRPDVTKERKLRQSAHNRKLRARNETLIRQYFEKNSLANYTECAKELKLSRHTVYKHLRRIHGERSKEQ